MDCPWTVHVLNSYQHAGPSHGLSASTHISTLALPMDCPWTVHVLNSYQHAGPSHGLMLTGGQHFIGQSEILWRERISPRTCDWKGGESNLSDKGLNLSGSWQQGHSATYNTPSHVPPQPNSPPDNVLRPDRQAEASLGSKRRDCYPALRGLALAPTAGYRSRASAPSIFGAS
uniref:Uncharacterized protein n=1 Tax=Brassica oleracea var. oleracea TaxID=109376 RepID=A0A0D2ZQ65_BRAOL